MPSCTYTPHASVNRDDSKWIRTAWLGSDDPGRLTPQGSNVRFNASGLAPERQHAQPGHGEVRLRQQVPGRAWRDQLPEHLGHRRVEVGRHALVDRLEVALQEVPLGLRQRRVTVEGV